jgi:hypothetical protein
MGALTLPASGLVYIDTMALIYTVERFPAYWPLLEPLWRTAQAGTVEVVSRVVRPLPGKPAGVEESSSRFLAAELLHLPGKPAGVGQRLP